MNTCEKCICAYRKIYSQSTAQCCLAGRHEAGPPAAGAPQGWGCRGSSRRVPSSTFFWVVPFAKIFFPKNLMGGQLGIPGTVHLTCTYPLNLPEMNAELHTLWGWKDGKKQDVSAIDVVVHFGTGELGAAHRLHRQATRPSLSWARFCVASYFMSSITHLQPLGLLSSPLVDTALFHAHWIMPFRMQT